MSLRAIPNNLYMGESSTFGQAYSYHTARPLGVVLTADYFMSVRSQLYAGDRINVCQVTETDRRRGRVIAIAELLVVEVTNDGVEIQLLRPVVEVPRRDRPGAPVIEPEPERYVKSDVKPSWNPGKKVFEVWDGAELVAEVRDKAQAWQIAQGEIPIPARYAA